MIATEFRLRHAEVLVPGALRDVLRATLQHNPDGIALQSGTTQLSYRQLTTTVQRAAERLSAVGIGRNSIVALLFENTAACVIGFLALAWIDAAVIPLPPETTPAELAAMIDAPSCGVLGSAAQYTRLGQACAQMRHCWIDIERLEAPPGSTAEHHRASTDAFIYHYTSGSTGKPKAALHTQANLVAGGIIYQQTYQIHRHDRILTTVPLAHSFGMVAGLVAALVSGARLVVCERFIPGRIARTLAEDGITIMLAVPLICDLLARSYQRDTPRPTSLRACLSSGSRLTAEASCRFQARCGVPIYQVYGSTETGVIAAQRPDDHDWPAQSVGRPLVGVQLRVVDEDGHESGIDEVGLLHVRTPALFAGYRDQPAATAAAFDDGWYITGDMARRDADGFLYLIGRKDTFINVAGKKVNPLEVEETLQTHPLVSQAMVFGREAGSAGQQVYARVVLKGPITQAALIAFCRARLAAYKVPASIEFVADLPKTSLGKVRRAAVQLAK